MDLFIADWLNLLIRWAHLVAGIGWIGTSFYFIALDVSLRRRPGLRPGVAGSAWEVHGGGFYHVEKYLAAPPDLPEDLLWYRWEAYLTWVTGFGLLAVQYYWNAGAYLIDPAVLALAPWQAVAISVVSLALGWLLYDLLCRSPLGRHGVALAAATFAMIVAAAFLFAQAYSGRGALIQVGSLVGTIMAANVFMVIIPNQRKITAALLAGALPDSRLGAIGKQRSLHNTYLTLPVLMLMVSNHYPMLTGHPQSWLLVALILVGGALVRHAFVRHEAGDPFARLAWAPGIAAFALLAALAVSAPEPRLAAAPGERVGNHEALAIARTHCFACHAARPTHEGFDEPPKDVVLESLADLRRFRDPVLQQAVHGTAMPLGNETGMTVEERRRLGFWLAQD